MRFFPVLLAVLPLAGCLETHVVIDQAKPIELNINFNGHLDLVVQDARADLEKINGEKPAQVVKPEDIGLPPTAGSEGPAVETRKLAGAEMMGGDMLLPVSLKMHLTKATVQPFFAIAKSDDLTQSMKRNGEIRGLWESKAVGESHTGLLVAKGQLTAAQQKLVAAENADRSALYELKAKEKSITTDEAALGYYIERLGYAKKGAWYEVRNAAGQWEWKEWTK